MEFIKWQNIIVEWVNCLNISKSIENIAELKNEDFFRALLQFLIQTDSSEEYFSLTDFLKKHYPAYYLESEPTLIQDDVEICNICSLLLHYCCLIDGRAQFTVPLCQNLNTHTQFCIKSFLEHIADAVIITRDVINDAVLCIIKSNTTPTKIKSPQHVQNTLLSEFLKTPFKKQPVLDTHKREIITLQAQLDFERFEKADLQEELNLQYTKNKKLEKVISDKQSEISKLRLELLNLETFSPPSNSSIANQENKRFKDEIKSLEKYVSILHKEQEELQNERDRARNKLAKIEDNNHEWQNRVLELERQNVVLNEENELHKLELYQLREKCKELSSILEELNAKNACNESYEIDQSQENFLHNRSGSIDYDNLAHTVVDVQLIDAQEENKCLREHINELQINSTSLTEQLSMLREEITKINSEHTALLEKMNDFEYKSRIMAKKLSETEFNLTYYQNESDSLNKNYDNLKQTNFELESKLNEFIDSNSKLQNSLTDLDTNISDLLNKSVLKFSFYFQESLIVYPDTVANLDNLLSKLQTKIKNDTQERESMTQKVAYLEEEILSSEKERNYMKSKIQHLQEESLKNDKLIIICKNTIDEKANEIVSLQQDLKRKEQTVQKMEIRTSELSSVVEDMEGTVNNLRDCLNKEKKEFDDHKIALKISQEKMDKNIKMYENRILNNDKIIDELTKENSNYSSKIQSLEELVKEVKEKMQEITEEKSREIYQLRNDYHKLMTQVEDYEEKLRDEKEAKDSLNLKLQTSETNFQSLKSKIEEIDEEKLKLSSSLLEIKGKLAQETSNRKNLETTCQTIRDEMKEKDTTIEKLLCQKLEVDAVNQQLKEDISNEVKSKNDAENMCVQLQNMIDDIELESKNIRTQFENETKRKNDAEDKCVELQNMIDDIQLESKNIRTQFEDFIIVSAENLQKHINNLNSKLEMAEHTNQTLKTNLENMTKAHEKKCNEIQELKEEMREMQKQVNERIEELLRAEKQEKDALTVKLENAESIIANLKIKIEERNKCVEEINKEKFSLSANLRETRVKLSEEEFCKKLVVENYEKIKNNLTEKENIIETLENQKVELHKNIVDLNKEIDIQTKNKSEIESKCNNLKKIIADVEAQMKGLKVDKSKLVHQFEDMKKGSFDNVQKHQENLSIRIQILKQELISAEESNRTLKIKLEEKNRALKEKSQKISILEEEKRNCEEIIVKLNEEIASKRKQKGEFEAELNDLYKTVKDKEILINNLKTEKNIVEDQLASLNNKFTIELGEKSTELEEHSQNFDLINIELSAIVKMFESEEDIQEPSENNLLAKIATVKNNICNLIFEKRRFENEITNLQQQIVLSENLKSTLDDEYKSKITEYKDKLKDYEQNLAQTAQNVQKMLQEHEKEIQNYKIQTETLQTDLKQIQSSYKKSIEILAEMQSSNHELEASNTDLNHKINDLNAKLLELSFDKTNLNIQLDELSSKMNILEQTREQITTEMEQSLKDSQENLSELLRELQEEKNKNSDLITICKKHFNKFSDLYLNLFDNDYNKDVLSEINKIKDQKELTYNKINDVNKLINNLFDLISNEISNLKKTAKQLSNNYEALKSDLSTLNHDLSTLKYKYDLSLNTEDENSKLNKKISDLNLEIAKYQQQISEKELDKFKYEKEIEIMKTTCDNWRKMLNENETEHKKLHHEFQNLKEKYQNNNEKLQITVVDLQQQIKNNNNVITEHESKYEELLRKYESANEKICRTDPEILNLETNITNYKKSIAEHESKYEELLRKYESANEKISRIDPEILNLQTKITNYKKSIAEHENKYEELLRKYESANEKIGRIDPEILNLQTKITNYKKCITELEEKNKVLTLNLAEYSELRAENSKLHLEYQVLRKTVEERSTQLSCLTHIKDSYEKLLEDNNKVNMELDTLRYKRTRDKEEFKRILEEQSVKTNEQIQVVRNEYEEKLKKMKEKIVKLYREEVEKEKKKVCTLQQGQTEETISALKSQLWVTGNKYVDLKKEYEKLASQVSKMKSKENCNDVHGSRNSLHSLPNYPSDNNLDDRRISTLPRDAKIEVFEESVTVTRKRRSITAVSGLQMEDEQGEIFNNTYLADLKAGRCVISDSMESISSTNSRMSELKYRNSLCPPHLKSSYPLETQFSSPGHFKEDDIKGAADLDDSVTVLLPGERKKKDWGQTLYKKPGPPTPSKHGGRLSFQGGEVAPLREQNPPAVQGPRNSSTPSRIRALFSRSGRDTENVTPRGPSKRRSIFRR